MAEETGQDKTEQPTPKRLREAREKGDIPRSKELSATVLLLAAGIPLALIVVEQFFIGSDYLSTAFGHHIPNPGNDDSRALGFYLYQPNIATLDYVGMLLGFIVAGMFLFFAVWFRKNRFES